MAKKKNKENEEPAGTTTATTGKKRCRWNGETDQIVVMTLLAGKAAGNQTDNAGFHSAAFTACSTALEGTETKSGGAVKSADACLTRWTTLKGQYALVKMLRNKSGWGWDDVEKHVVVEDDVWNAFLAINGKIAPWCFKGFPLYDEMSQLVDGAVATGAGAFLPGRPADTPGSPAWSVELRDDDDKRDIPIDPILLGPAGRVDFPSGAGTAGDAGEDSDMDDGAQMSSVSRRRVRAISDSPPEASASKRRRTDGHGHCRRSHGGRRGTPSPKRKTEAVKIIMTIPIEKFSKEERNLILRLIRADTGIADLFLAIGDDMDARIDYLREELKP
ncbi:hypothetical protein C8R47DRAFT_1073792 [Mycena vitilis]|nr:hypothetical protein C8R47DRAFT_1073792 [Mycena vitilis]